jgi:hypothetical protein
LTGFSAGEERHSSEWSHHYRYNLPAPVVLYRPTVRRFAYENATRVTGLKLYGESTTDRRWTERQVVDARPRFQRRGRTARAFRRRSPEGGGTLRAFSVVIGLFRQGRLMNTRTFFDIAGEFWLDAQCARMAKAVGPTGAQQDVQAAGTLWRDAGAERHLAFEPQFCRCVATVASWLRLCMLR